MKCGFSNDSRKRQKWECRFELLDGTAGSHRFTEPIPRLVAEAPLCDHCGQPLENWRGSQVFKNYYFLAEPIADALVDLANGKTYRQTSADFYRRVNNTANPADPRRLQRRARIALLAQSNPIKAARLRARRPYRSRSNEPNLAQWLVEACAEILWRELAPQAWPAGGIVAVDAVKMNLLGKHKHVRLRGRTVDEVLEDLIDGDEPEEEFEEPEIGESGYPEAPEDVVEITIPPIENADHSLEDMLDPNDQDEAMALAASGHPQLTVIQGTVGQQTVGTQGGVPCWQILGAYGYEPNLLGEFPRDEITGKPWLFRADYQPDSLTWAHFFRLLPGTPAYILCDGAHDIRVGVELAWTDAATRPQIITCEYHVMKAVERHVVGNPVLMEAANRLFLGYGREIRGRYQKYIPNGAPGSVRRLWHLMDFRRKARRAGYGDFFDRLLRTPTWNQIKRQIIAKDDSLKYSTGALEAALFRLAETKVRDRRTWLRNRERTDHLLMLLQLGMLGLANRKTFIDVIEHYLIDEKEAYAHLKAAKWSAVVALNPEAAARDKPVPKKRRPEPKRSAEVGRPAERPSA